MHRYCPSWSRTQQDLFFKCPTAWAMTYGLRNEAYFGGKTTLTSTWDLMLRSLKATVVEQLEALRSGVEWTQSVARIALRQRLKEVLGDHRRTIEHPRFEALLLFANHRMQLLWRSDVFVGLTKGKHTQWSVLNRLESERVGGFDLFASPDIVFRIQEKWHLVRLDMQARKMNHSERLEAYAMVLWSMNRDGLPSVADQFHIQTIGWRKGAWRVHPLSVSSQEVAVARTLIESDVAAMEACANAVRYAPLSLPLAANESTCTTCRMKPTCLEESTLEEKKRERINTLALEAQ